MIYIAGAELSEIIKACLMECKRIELEVRAIVADGTSTNLTAARLLGASLDPEAEDVNFHVEGHDLVWIMDVS